MLTVPNMGPLVALSHVVFLDKERLTDCKHLRWKRLKRFLVKIPFLLSTAILEELMSTVTLNLHTPALLLKPFFLPQGYAVLLLEQGVLCVLPVLCAALLFSEAADITGTCCRPCVSPVWE